MKRELAPARVRLEWLRRVEAEYRSAALTQHLVLWLIQMGVSPDLVLAGLRIVRDEMAHAALSHRVYVAAGGEELPRMDRETLELARGGGTLEKDVARACVEVFCLGETLAVRLFKDLRQRCQVPVARRALDRILRDEVRHRAFGWTLLGALLDSPAGPRVRSVIVRELPASFAGIRASYGLPAGEKPSNMSRDETRWGLMPAARYGEILARTFERDYVPRFRELGVEARDAWR